MKPRVISFTPRPRKYPIVGAATVSLAAPTVVAAPAPAISTPSVVAIAPAVAEPSASTVLVPKQRVVDPSAGEVASTVVETTSLLTSALHWGVFGFGIYGIYRFATRGSGPA